VTATVDGLKAADEGARFAADAEKALASILQGVEEVSGAVREIDHANGEQVHVVQSLVQSIAKVHEEGRGIARAAAEQTQATLSASQGASEMRRMARQTREATSEQAKAVRDVDVYIEQPCLSYEECLSVRRKTDHPFVLDEVIDSVDVLIRGRNDLAMDAVNIKISKFGGLTKARQARDLCAALGIAMTIEDSWGGDIVTAAIAHLAQHVPVRPGAHALAMTQDRLTEKTFIEKLGLKTAPFFEVSSVDPLNLRGIILPGEKVPAISGRFLNLGDDTNAFFVREETGDEYQISTI